MAATSTTTLRQATRRGGITILEKSLGAVAKAGSTYGCKPTPLLKPATNTPMFQRMALDRGARQVVVKLGPEGAYFAQRDGAAGLHVPRVVQFPGDADGLPTRLQLQE